MKKIIWLIAFFILAIGCFVGYKFYENNKEKAKEKAKEELILDIKKHYNELVVVKKDTKLYKYSTKYEEAGKISANNELSLQKIEVNENNKYFKIKDLEYYVYYKDVEKINSLKEVDTRYEKYIPFNENIVTNEVTTFTDEFNNTITFNESFDLPIIIKDTDKYGVSFNNRLCYVNKEDIKSIHNNVNSKQKTKESIITLGYHFIYDEKTETCNQAICHTFTQFESHLKYLKDNDYLTLRLPELEMYLDGKINLPEKSVTITIDDGTILNPNFTKLLDKYETYATLFVITGWVNHTKFVSEYLDFESHTHKMHNQFECKGMGLQGGGILCKDEEFVLNDLKTSQEKLGGSVYFAYPFFDVNDRAVELLKKAGFHMAFVGQYNTNGFSKPGRDKYRVPRKSIFNSTTLNDFINLVN